MAIKIVKTDGRHAGYDYFSYYAELKRTEQLNANIIEFNLMRVWCWEQWGVGTERDSYPIVNDFNGWAWHIYGPIMRIYFDAEPKASWFALKWG